MNRLFNLAVLTAMATMLPLTVIRYLIEGNLHGAFWCFMFGVSVVMIEVGRRDVKRWCDLARSAIDLASKSAGEEGETYLR